MCKGYRLQAKKKSDLHLHQYMRFRCFGTRHAEAYINVARYMNWEGKSMFLMQNIHFPSHVQIARTEDAN